MISRTEALVFAETEFPRGPEKLARYLGLIVERAPLVGCEGWCCRRGERGLIRVNSTSSLTRQRFTLAHELAHLILGTRPGITHEPFRSDTDEERKADQLASELLIPEPRVRAYLGNRLPIDAKLLQRLAKFANVSPIMVACRIVGVSDVLALPNAAVAFFDNNGKYQWRYSAGLSFADEEAMRLFERARSNRSVIRVENADGNIVVCSVIDTYGYAALFLQLLPREIAIQQTTEERRTELKECVFGADYSFQQSVASCLGHIRNEFPHLPAREALQKFDEKYLTHKWSQRKQEKLRSPAGREFLLTELRRSCQPD